MCAADADGRSFRHPTGSAALALTVVALPSFLVGAFAPTIKEDLGFGDTALGALFTVGFLVSAVALQVTGRVADRRGPTLSLRLGMVLAAAASLFMSTAATAYALLLLAFGLNRLAEAMVQPATNTLISRSVPARQRGRAMGAKQSAIPLATALAGLSVPVLGGAIGWRGTFALVAALAVPAFLLVPRHVPPGAQASRTRGDLWRTRHLQLISAGGALAAGSVITVAGFLTTAAEEAGYSEGTAGLLLTLGGVVMIGSRLVWGWLADRFVFDRFLVVAGAIGVGSVAYPLLAAGSKPTIALGTALVFGVGWSWPGLVILGVVEHHPGEPGAATAVLQTSIRVGALASPVAFGALADGVGFGAAWMLSFGLALGATALMLAGSRLAPDLTRSAAAPAAPSMPDPGG